MTVTRTAVLRVVSALAWVAVYGLLAAERRIVRALRRASALNPETAIHLATPRPLSRWRLARLHRAGVVVAAGSDRFYLSPDGYTAYRQRRRRRALAVLAVVLPIFGLLWWIS